jgi:hypothetical protein
VLVGLVGGLVLPLATVPAAQAEEPPEEPFAVVSTAPPTIQGTAAYGEVVTADPGAWEPADVTLDYQWLLDGEPVDDATRRRYRPGLDDLGHRLKVEVTATATDPETGETAETVARSERCGWSGARSRASRDPRSRGPAATTTRSCCARGSGRGARTTCGCSGSATAVPCGARRAAGTTSGSPTSGSGCRCG